MINFKECIALVILLFVINLMAVQVGAQTAEPENEAAVFLQKAGLLKGDDSGNLMLDKQLTREEMVVILSRLLKSEDEAKIYPVRNLLFQDVPGVGEYRHYIAWAKENSILKGYSEEEFGFKDYLTGWQAEALLVRTLGYTDIPDEDIADKAQTLGILRGVELEEQKPILRGTMALLMYNALSSKGKDGKVLAQKLGITMNNIKSGVFVQNEGWVYYSNSADGNKLYRIKPDQTMNSKLDDSEIRSLDVKDGWVYFSNASDNGKLYKIRIDGTEKTKLNDDKCSYISVAGNQVYYANESDSSKVYKANLDGTGKVALNNDISAFLKVSENWVYYRNMQDNGKLYRIETDGSNRAKLTDDQAIFANISGDWIYYIALSGNQMTLFKIKADGSDKVELSKNPLALITNNAGAEDAENFSENIYNNTDGDWVYYSNQSDEGKLYKKKTDGTNQTKLGDDQVEFVNVSDGWIYYINKSDYWRIYKEKVEGTDKISVNRDFSSDMVVLGNSIYYRNMQDNAKLYRIGTDGSNMIKLIDEQAMFVNIEGDWLYYIVPSESNMEFYRIKSDGTEKAKITEDVMQITASN